VTDDALVGSSIRGDATVCQVLLSGKSGRARHGGGSRGEKVVQQTTWGMWATLFRDNTVGQWVVLSGDRQQ
jgi:hypothetical protein